MVDASAIRLPNRDVVANITQVADTGEIEKYLFNDIGGTELINLVRNDSVSGMTFNYSVISDLMVQDRLFDPSFLLINKSRYQSEFDRYAIRLANRIPETDFYDSNTVVPDTNVGTNVYFQNTDLVIEFDNMKDDELVQVEVLTAGRIYNMRENDYQ
jgi:hypothetical protein